jgi:hypothetical protein
MSFEKNFVATSRMNFGFIPMSRGSNLLYVGDIDGAGTPSELAALSL